jgi:hypothetical protein
VSLSAQSTYFTYFIHLCGTYLTYFIHLCGILRRQTHAHAHQGSLRATHADAYQWRGSTSDVASLRCSLLTVTNRHSSLHPSAPAQQRLLELGDFLVSARAARVPLFSLSTAVEGVGANVPFDAATVVGSQVAANRRT